MKFLHLVAKGTVDEVLAFDEVVAEAVAFARRHPDETLIVVTADHETGGMTLGNDGKRDKRGIACLAEQKMTYNKFNQEIFAPWKATATWTSVEDNVPEDLKQQVEQAFGLVWADLSFEQAALLERAYDSSVGGMAAGPAIYGKREAFPLAISRVMDERAGVGWTTFGHSPAALEGVGRQASPAAAASPLPVPVPRGR